MGTRCPVPKRSDQRVRRNQYQGPTDKVTAIGAVTIPELNFDDPHPIVADMYRSLTESAQRKYYAIRRWPSSRRLPNTPGLHIAVSEAVFLDHGVDQLAPAFVGVDEELRIVVLVGDMNGMDEQLRTDLGDK